MNNYSLNFVSGRKITDIYTNGNKKGSIYLYDPNYKCRDECKGKKCCNYHDLKDSTTRTDHIIADKGATFLPAFNNLKDQISTFYITGSQGTGKSVLAAKLIKEYKRENKGCPVYCISEAREDATIDNLINKKIMPQEIKDDNLTFEDFQDIACEYGSALILFDDIDSINDQKIKGISLKHITYQLLNSLINNSRKYNINIIYTAHQPLQGAYSKAVLNSCSNWIFFTANLKNPNVVSCLKNYMNMNKRQIDGLSHLDNTRWISINQTIPQTITTETETFILN